MCHEHEMKISKSEKLERSLCKIEQRLISNLFRLLIYYYYDFTDNNWTVAYLKEK